MMKYISTNIFVSSLLMIKYGSLPPSEGVDVSVDVGLSPVHVGNHVKSM